MGKCVSLKLDVLNVCRNTWDIGRTVREILYVLLTARNALSQTRRSLWQGVHPQTVYIVAYRVRLHTKETELAIIFSDLCCCLNSVQIV